MPSWNIHIAHAERLFARGGATTHVVLDRNAFLFGSLVPDIYVGYMVPAVEKPIAYRTTHFATPSHIPKPREGEFWNLYVAPMADELNISASGVRTGDCIEPASLALEQDRVNRIHYPQRFGPDDVVPKAPGTCADTNCSAQAIRSSLFDFILGVWVHLLADNLWNTRVNQFLDAHGGKPGESFRIKKQGDFDLFGKALPIDLVPRATPRLIATAAAFPQYPIEELPLLYTIGVAHETVRTNHGHENPDYQLLTTDFFEHVFGEFQELADGLMEQRLG